MTSSYEQRIVEAMLRRAEALERGDDQTAAAQLVEAGDAAQAMRRDRGWAREGATGDPAVELEAVKP